MDKTVILKEIISYYGFNKAEFARFLGMTPQALNNWKSRNTYTLKRICEKCEEFNPQWILSGEGPMLKEEYQTREISISTKEDPENYQILEQKRVRNIPLYDLKHSSSLEAMLKKGIGGVNQVNFLRIPDFPKCDGAAYVSGDSMLPVLKNKDIIIFKKISVNKITWGGMGLVEFVWENEKPHLTLGYFHKSELGKEYIKLISENPKYIPIDVSLDKITAMAQILSIIKNY